MNKQRITEIGDIEVIVESANTKMTGTPSVYDLDEIIQALRHKHSVDSFFIRRKLAWVMRRAYKDLGIVCRNPWWMPKNFR